jgi:AcrR family transcriptional regulator
MTALDTRRRILMAAEEVFSAEGVRAGGVHRIAERAGVTKRTLYYHFRSKDDLIAACLAEHAGPVTDCLPGWTEVDAGPVAERVARVLQGLAQSAAQPRWRGCGFLRAAFELAELPGHPARLLAADHKRRLEAWLAEQIAREDLPDAAGKARGVMLVLDGTIAQLLLHRDADYAAQATEIVRLILAAPQDCAA